METLLFLMLDHNFLKMSNSPITNTKTLPKEGTADNQSFDVGVRVKQRRGRAQSKRKVGYWRKSQQQKYVQFVRKNLLFMNNAQLRAEMQIFKKMSEVVESRSAVQCKSHHQKMLMRYGNNLLNIIAAYSFPSNYLSPLYQQQEEMSVEHLSKIRTGADLPYFMIKSPRKLLIVIDQQFIGCY